MYVCVCVCENNIDAIHGILTLHGNGTGTESTVPCTNLHTGPRQERNQNPLFPIVPVQFLLSISVPFPCDGSYTLHGTGTGNGEMGMQPIGPGPDPVPCSCPCVVYAVKGILYKPIVPDPVQCE